MNDYIPTEVKDLTESKKRVMRNVVNEIENTSRRPKYKWRYVVISAVLTLSAMLFVLNEVLPENEPSVAEQPFPKELPIDFSKPTLSEEQGFLHLVGVTLGDTRAKVIEQLGENYTYTIVQVDSGEADFVMDYYGQAKFSFIGDKLDSIVFMNVDENYYDKLFNNYNGFKFFYSSSSFDRFFYSNETNQVLKASTDTIDENLELSLYYPEQRIRENAEYLYMTQQNMNNQHVSSTDLNIDLAKPTFSEEHGYLYFHGVTLGDLPSKVIEQFGENYIIGQADGSGADFIMEYNRMASFHFYKNKLEYMTLRKVDKDYFDELFNDYDGFKFISSSHDADNDRYIYSKETFQILKATTQVPNKDLYLSIGYPDPSFYEHPEMKDFPNPWE